MGGINAQISSQPALLDFVGTLPAYINITYGKTTDNKEAHDIHLLKGFVIAADRFSLKYFLQKPCFSKILFQQCMPVQYLLTTNFTVMKITARSVNRNDFFKR